MYNGLKVGDRGKELMGGGRKWKRSNVFILHSQESIIDT